MTAEELTEALTGYNALVRFQLSAGAAGNPPYQLTLVLANKVGETRTLLCEEVQHLELNPHGRRLDLRMELHVEDMSDAGLERIRFSVEEMERETIFLHCANLLLLES